MKQKIVALLYLGNYTLGHALLVNVGDKKKRNFVNRTETWILFLAGMLVVQLLDISWILTGLRVTETWILFLTGMLVVQLLDISWIRNLLNTAWACKWLLSGISFRILEIRWSENAWLSIRLPQTYFAHAKLDFPGFGQSIDGRPPPF